MNINIRIEFWLGSRQEEGMVDENSIKHEF